MLLFVFISRKNLKPFFHFFKGYIYIYIYIYICTGFLVCSENFRKNLDTCEADLQLDQKEKSFQIGEFMCKHNKNPNEKIRKIFAAVFLKRALI